MKGYSREGTVTKGNRTTQLMLDRPKEIRGTKNEVGV